MRGMDNAPIEYQRASAPPSRLPRDHFALRVSLLGLVLVAVGPVCEASALFFMSDGTPFKLVFLISGVGLSFLGFATLLTGLVLSLIRNPIRSRTARWGVITAFVGLGTLCEIVWFFGHLHY
jgi:hypothetical protein